MSGRRIALALCCALALVALMARAPQARADADPASDTLLIARVFYPYDPTVSTQQQTALNQLTATLAKKGLAVRVALIQSATDLGAVPTLFGHPQTYAAFLDREISVEGKPGTPLLVVMANGYGEASLPAASVKALSALPAPGRAGANPSDTLASAASSALVKLAAADGIAIQAPVSSGGGGGGAIVIVVVVVVVVLIAAGIAAVLRTRRRRVWSTDGGESGAHG